MDWPGAGTRIYLLGSMPTCTANNPGHSQSRVSEQSEYGSIQGYWRWNQDELLRKELQHHGSLLLPTTVGPPWSKCAPGMHRLAVSCF